MTKAPAPSTSRYFGTNRIHISSPVPMTTIAASKMTTFRLSPRKSASRDGFKKETLLCGNDCQGNQAGRKREKYLEQVCKFQTPEGRGCWLWLEGDLQIRP